MYYGLLGASAVAFSGATDFVPELNRWLQIVEMDQTVSRPIYRRDGRNLTSADQFMFKLTTTMIVDFVGCWVIEVICKWLFAELEPKAMITRGRERREARRRQEATQQNGIAAVGKKQQ